MRAFFALELPEEARAALGAWQRRQAESWRWARAEGLHLTLAFLGELDTPAIEAAKAVGQGVAMRHAAFDLCTTELGGFPRAEAARILWLGLEAAPALNRLAEELRYDLGRADLPFDPKPFRAHLTLGRSDRPRSTVGLRDPEAFAWSATELNLLSSLAGRYEAKGRWTFG
jgi:2'-5' RNA ligase